MQINTKLHIACLFNKKFCIKLFLYIKLIKLNYNLYLLFLFNINFDKFYNFNNIFKGKNMNPSFTERLDDLANLGLAYMGPIASGCAKLAIGGISLGTISYLAFNALGLHNAYTTATTTILISSGLIGGAGALAAGSLFFLSLIAAAYTWSRT